MRLSIAALWPIVFVATAHSQSFQFIEGMRQPDALSSDGKVVAGLGPSPGDEIVVWEIGQAAATPLVPPAGWTNMRPKDLSADGSILVGWGDHGQSREAFRWDRTTGVLQGLGFLPGGETLSSPFSEAYAVSADGSVVAGRSNFSLTAGIGGFRWTAAAGMENLGGLRPVDSLFATEAWDISANGLVVEGRSNNNSAAGDAEAFRWTVGGGMIGLGDLPGGHSNSVANGVSGDGTVVVGQAGSANSGFATSEAFRWTQADGIDGLGDLAGGQFWSYALAASANGEVVVGVSEPTAFVARAWIWDVTHGMRNLQSLLANDYGLPATGLLEANDISGDGRTIVGLGINGAWIAVIPEPQTLSLLVTAATMLIATWRKKSSGAIAHS